MASPQHGPHKVSVCGEECHSWRGAHYMELRYCAMDQREFRGPESLSIFS